MALQIPGTPAVKLPAFVAPSFAAARVPLGGVVTDVSFKSTGTADQLAVPFTFGQVFERGHLAPTDGLFGRLPDGEVINLQVQHRASHPDGSVRHSAISGILPFIAPGAVLRMELVRARLVIDEMMGEAPADKVVVQAVHLGVPYVAGPAVAPRVSHYGAVMTEWRSLRRLTDASGIDHKELRAQISVRKYSTGHIRTDVVYENCDAFVANLDIVFDARVIDAATGDVLVDLPGTVFARGQRHRRTFWHGEPAPQLHIAQNSAYFIGSLQVPSLDQRVKPAPEFLDTLARNAKTGNYGPGGFGRFNPSMPTAGGRNELALMPDSHAALLLSMDERAYAAVMADANAAGSWGIHVRDTSAGPLSGYPLDVMHFPHVSNLQNASDTMNKLTGVDEKLPMYPTGYRSANIGQADVAHQPAFSYVPYLLTADDYHLDELHFWNNYNSISNNPVYRHFSKGLLHRNQVRGQAWAFRTLAQCVAITPDDHPAKPGFIYSFDENVKYYLARYVDKTIRFDGSPLPAPEKRVLADEVSELGFLNDGYATNYKAPNLPGTTITPDGMDFGVGVGPWQDDFVTASWFHAYELTGDPGVLRFLQWKCRFVMERMGGAGACWIDAGVSVLRVRDLPTTPLYRDIATCYRKTLGEAVFALPCNSPERLALMNSKLTEAGRLGLSEIYNYPAVPTGYAAQMQGALAAAVAIDYPGALAQWSRYESRNKKQLYQFGPQFAIVPRVPAVSDPLPEVPPTPTPLPDVPPTPTPTPTPTPPEDLPKPAPASLTISSERLVKGEKYVVTVTSEENQILVVQFPVVAT